MLRRKAAQLKAIEINAEQKALKAEAQSLYNPSEELQSAEYNNAARAFNATLKGDQVKLAMVVTEDKEEEKEAFIAWEELPEEEAYLIAYFWVPVSERGQGKGRRDDLGLGLEGIGVTRRGRYVLGDTIVGVDGKPVDSADDMRDRFEDAGVGASVKLVVERDGELREVEVELQRLGAPETARRRGRL